MPCPCQYILFPWTGRSPTGKCNLGFPPVLQGVPCRNSADFYWFTYILQGVPLEIHGISSSLHLCCKGDPLGILWISFARGIFRNSFDCHWFAAVLQGVPLRSSSDFYRLTLILQREPLRDSSHFHTFAHILQRLPLRNSVDFYWFKHILQGIPLGSHSN